MSACVPVAQKCSLKCVQCQLLFIGFSFGSTGGAISSTSAFAPSSIATTTVSQFKGLGGTSTTTNASSQDNDGVKSNGSNQALKEANIPSELAKDVDEFE